MRNLRETWFVCIVALSASWCYASPPTADIALESVSVTRMSPSAVVVRVDPSTFNSGDGSFPEECFFKWVLSRDGGLASWPSKYRYVTDPRDGTSQIDLSERQRGRTVGWILTDGDWTIDLMAFNASGECSHDSVNVTVDTNKRTAYTIGSGGDYSTLAAALNDSVNVAGQDNIELEILDGHTETISTNQQPSGKNWWIHHPGSDANIPIFTINSSTGFTLNRELQLIEHIKVSSGQTASTSGPIAFKLALSGGNSTTKFPCVARCVIDGSYSASANRFYEQVTSSPSSSTRVTGALLFANTCGPMMGYAVSFAPGGTSDTHVTLGCRFLGSTDQVIYRTTAAGVNSISILFSRLDFDTPANPAPGNKQAVRLTSTTNSDIYGCLINDGGLWIGESGTSEEPLYTRCEACRFTGTASSSVNHCLVTLRNGAQGVFLCNSIYDMADSHGIQGTFSTSLGLERHTAHCNTFKVTAAGLKPLRNTTNESLPLWMANANLTLVPSSHNQPQFELTSASIVTIDDNVFTPDASITYNGVCSINGSAATLSTLNGQSWADGNVEATVTLDGDYLPSGASPVATPLGVFEDYYGNGRAVSSLPGAVNEPPNPLNNCGAADINSNCVVDVDDLLAIINHWGNCPGGPCPWDIYPVGNPNGVVNQEDLLQLISVWGDCDDC